MKLIITDLDNTLLQLLVVVPYLALSKRSTQILLSQMVVQTRYAYP